MESTSPHSPLLARPSSRTQRIIKQVSRQAKQSSISLDPETPKKSRSKVLLQPLDLPLHLVALLAHRTHDIGDRI